MPTADTLDMTESAAWREGELLDDIVGLRGHVHPIRVALGAGLSRSRPRRGRSTREDRRHGEARRDYARLRDPWLCIAV